MIDFFCYAHDKFKPKRQVWRTPESTLHLLALCLLELLGSWPGFLLAQQMLRHKSSKQDFRVIFWFTVVINLAVLGGLLSLCGETVLILMPNNIGRF
ncbi:DUF1294 domain-containing protein [Glaciecola sp. 33A]|uniref:DUF1294 domain-containing protein n=1 Tax=Glaciecola sp. 33A TaxID=2057807 RepID=UPI001E367FC1|nr:DUF1294 domain-containing protein [Glaciecola sp. 33A]